VGRLIAMREQILVPLDGSGLAEKALPHARAVAKATSKSLVLLLVVPPPVPLGEVGWAMVPAVNPDMGKDWEDELSSGRKYLEEVAASLISEGFDVHTEILEGDPAVQIVRYAEQHPSVTLIVMSTHGHSGLARWVFGSVTEKVVQASPVPLMIIRAQKQTPDAGPADALPPYNTIVVPLDGSQFAEQALEHAVPLATAVGSKLVLTCAVPNEHGNWEEEPGINVDYLGHTKQKLASRGLQVETHIQYGIPEEVIVQTSDSMHADLIVMTTHGRGGLQRLWLGSVAIEVARHASQPVLLVRAKERVKDTVKETERFAEKMVVPAIP
jgi:nucleotide-binding universal stress UspA family protein